MPWYAWVLIVMAALEVAGITYFSSIRHVRVYGLKDAVVALVYLPLFIWAIAILAGKG